jgi:hypothetical protein
VGQGAGQKAGERAGWNSPRSCLANKGQGAPCLAPADWN